MKDKTTAGDDDDDDDDDAPGDVAKFSMINRSIYFSLTQLYYTNNLREHSCMIRLT